MDIDIGRFLAKRALLDGGRIGLIAGEQRLTFAALNAAANRAAHALAKLGVKRGDRVAVLLRNGVEYVALYYAAAKIGAILCGINWRLAAPEVAFILGDGEPNLLIYDMDFCATVDALPSGRVPFFAAGDEIGTRPGFAALMAEAPAHDPEAVSDPDDPLVLVYTSGTTGRPKGAVLTHRQMFWASATMAATHDYKQGDLNLVPTPLFHVGGLSFATLFVHMGATLLLPRVWEPGAVLGLIETERVTHFFAVPAMLRSLLEHPALATADLSSLRWILGGGAPVPPSLIAAFAERGIPVQQSYGATETAGPATSVDLAHALAKAGSAGLPYFHTDLRIVGRDGSELPHGEVGEVQVRGPHIFAGYWRNLEATAAAFAGEWLKTGDLARRDAEGYLYIVDRAKDVVISGGENIYPAEIEAVLATHPGIAEAAVVGVPDAEWGEIPCAVIVPKGEAAPTLDGIRAHCQDKLARFKLPRRLVVSREPLPRNATGKLLKAAIRTSITG